jgi:hypothetical protein
MSSDSRSRLFDESESCLVELPNEGIAKLNDEVACFVRFRAGRKRDCDLEAMIQGVLLLITSCC